MSRLNLREFKAYREKNGLANASARIAEALQAGQLKPQDFSIKDLAEELVADGREWVRSLDPRHNHGFISESSSVDTSAFSNITGQIVYSAFLSGYERPEFVMTKAIPVIPTQFNGEKIPGIGGIGDKVESIGEGELYPSAGLNEDYIETPMTTKKGLKIPVTKEAIFFDRTNMIVSKASSLGEELGRNKEKRLTDLVIGVTNSYKWRGTTYSTYQSASPWINIKTGNTLVDWSNVDSAEQLMFNLLDPNTNEPISVTPKHIVVNRAYLNAAIRAVAPVVASITPGYATSGNPTKTEFGVYRAGSYEILYSSYVNARQTLASQDSRYWYNGDLTKAFAYMENWPITVVQAPANHPDEFDRDIVLQYKASERGTAAVMDPRYMVQNQN